ncbi:hypothetical protein K440DRAFT_156478 [Wilcoxina mikolae CBS 423.85]|nr:hypothetical protein K440DRAFT_156478 [Wilcoxina mikolae CBS 423.85]
MKDSKVCWISIAITMRIAVSSHVDSVSSGGCPSKVFRCRDLVWGPCTWVSLQKPNKRTQTRGKGRQSRWGLRSGGCPYYSQHQVSSFLRVSSPLWIALLTNTGPISAKVIRLSAILLRCRLPFICFFGNFNWCAFFALFYFLLAWWFPVQRLLP